MATRRRSVSKKKPTKKAPRKAKAVKKVPRKKNKKPFVISAKKKADSSVVDVKDLVVRERARRPSKFDGLAVKLLANPGKAVVQEVPKGKKPEVFRTMLYTRLPKCLDHAKKNHGKKPSISILENGNLGITLVKS